MTDAVRHLHQKHRATEARAPVLVQEGGETQRGEDGGYVRKLRIEGAGAQYQYPTGALGTAATYHTDANPSCTAADRIGCRGDNTA